MNVPKIKVAAHVQNVYSIANTLPNRVFHAQITKNGPAITKINTNTAAIATPRVLNIYILQIRLLFGDQLLQF